MLDSNEFLYWDYPSIQQWSSLRNVLPVIILLVKSERIKTHFFFFLFPLNVDYPWNKCSSCITYWKLINNIKRACETNLQLINEAGWHGNNERIMRVLINSDDNKKWHASWLWKGEKKWKISSLIKNLFCIIFWHLFFTFLLP